jgi:hypothetical protein
MVLILLSGLAPCRLWVSEDHAAMDLRSDTNHLVISVFSPVDRGSVVLGIIFLSITTGSLYGSELEVQEYTKVYSQLPF